MNALCRIIDANANRAREALRVMEDAARFALDDAALSAAAKALRHDLRAALEGAGVDRGLLLAARDTPGDVGTAVSTPSEMRRSGVREVAAAAAARLAEALRSVEECLKALGADARGVEALRYRAYTLERSLLLALGAGARPWRLCVLVTESLCRAHPWEEVARRAVRGGADCLQLREKGLPDRELLRRARRLVGIARGEGGAAVVINDRPDLALLAGADGVHIGQEDLAVESVRRIAGFSLVVGVSTSTVDEARAAVRAGADLCGVGPMFPTTTKHKERLAGPPYLREYLADPVLAAVPHLAIGGIGPGNIAQLAAAGCRGVAVSSAVCGAADPEGVCAALLAGLGGEETVRRGGGEAVR